MSYFCFCAIGFTLCFHKTMGAEVFTGIIGVAGAAVGGAASFAGTWANLRSQRRQATTARRQAVQDRRYAAHLNYIQGVDRFCEAARDVRKALERGRDIKAQQIERAQKGHIKTWAELRELKGAAELAGPPKLAAAIRKLHNAIANYSTSIDDWYLDAIAALSVPDLDQVDQICTDNALPRRSERIEVDEVREQYLVQAEEFFSQ